MTRGISEERLKEIRENLNKFDIRGHSTINQAINECKELNQWQPIDENTPKDREILVSNGYQYFIGIWNTTQNCWVDDSGSINPTHWQELPKNPPNVPDVPD